MFPVYLASDLVDAELVKHELLNAGLSAVVRNQHLQGALGELPANLNPEVCVLREEDEEPARELIVALEEKRKASAGEDVSCPKCGEPNPYNFEICWSCRADL